MVVPFGQELRADLRAEGLPLITYFFSLFLSDHEIEQVRTDLGHGDGHLCQRSKNVHRRSLKEKEGEGDGKKEERGGRGRGRGG